MRLLALAAAASILATAAFADEKPACTVGMPVSVLACINYPGHLVARDAAKGTWKVRCDSSKEESWVTASDLRLNCKAADAAIDTRYFLGRWDMFTGGGPSYYERQGYVWREQTAAAHTPPLQINADGTYAWTDYKKTWKGRWRALKPAEQKYAYRGVTGPAILLIKAQDGADWQVTRGGTNSADNRDRIEIEQMKLGITYRGVRLK